MRISPLVRCAAIVVLVGCLTSTVHAEVAAIPRSGGLVDTLVIRDLGITDGVDPIPQIWLDVRNNNTASHVLNATGAIRGDGAPDIAFRPENGWPVVVWAYNRGMSYDIAIASWQGNGWSAAEFVTDTPENELNPRIFIRPNGTIHVVWWVGSGDQRVMLATQTTDGEPWPAVRVSPIGEAGRRPTVAVHDGVLRVAYERDAAAQAFHPAEIVVRMLDGGSPDEEAVAAADWDEPLDPILHVQDGFLWVDWKTSGTQFGYTRLASPDWEGLNTKAWPDPSWIGEETTRREIAKQVLFSASTLPVAE